MLNNKKVCYGIDDRSQWIYSYLITGLPTLRDYIMNTCHRNTFNCFGTDSYRASELQFRMNTRLPRASIVISVYHEL